MITIAMKSHNLNIPGRVVQNYDIIKPALLFGLLT